jgi:hypothetical protein
MKKTISVLSLIAFTFTSLGITSLFAQRPAEKPTATAKYDVYRANYARIDALNAQIERLKAEGGDYAASEAKRGGLLAEQVSILEEVRRLGLESEFRVLAEKVTDARFQRALKLGWNSVRYEAPSATGAAVGIPADAAADLRAVEVTLRSTAGGTEVMGLLAQLAKRAGSNAKAAIAPYRAFLVSTVSSLTAGVRPYALRVAAVSLAVTLATGGIGASSTSRTSLDSFPIENVAAQMTAIENYAGNTAEAKVQSAAMYVEVVQDALSMWRNPTPAIVRKTFAQIAFEEAYVERMYFATYGEFPNPDQKEDYKEEQREVERSCKPFGPVA